MGMGASLGRDDALFYSCRVMIEAALNRRSFLGATAAAFAAQRPQPQRPNIVLILADDMGFSDIGCYGSEIRTPNLDGLAKGGVRFTHFYNSARCCPTRASLLTGLHPHQAGVGHMVDNPKPFPGYTGDLSAECVTIAEALGAAGYQTMMAGKWHVTPVTESKHNWPLQRGFERYYGIIHGAADFFNPVTLTRDNQAVEPEGDNYYFTDAIASNAARYVRSAAVKEQPFFLYVAFTAPHWPLHALQADIDRYRGRYKAGWDGLRQERHRRMIEQGIVDERWPLTPRDERVPAWSEVSDKEWQQRRMEVYAAQVDRMDQGIGQILKGLRDTGQEENTLVLFLSDNGGCAEEIAARWGGLHIPKTTRSGQPVKVGNDASVMPGPDTTYQSYGIPWANASCTPFRMYKHWVHEGGIATPLIAHWPKGIERRGQITREPGHLVDIMATCLDVAGARYPTERRGQRVTPLEGTSLRPAWSGQALRRDRLLAWEHEGNRALRDGKWKLVAKHEQSWELYDLSADRTEMTDLSQREPARLRKMIALYDSWTERVGARPWDQVQSAPRTPAPIPKT
jgi:arylsulfatase